MVGGEVASGTARDGWGVEQAPPHTLLDAAIGSRRVLWWLGGAAVVAAAWLLGRDAWSPGNTAGFGRVHFDWYSDVFTFWVLGVPSCLVAAWLLGSRRAVPCVVGLIAVVLTAAGLSVMAFGASFAGICFDAGRDTCVVTRPAHFAHLVSPLLVMLVGAGVTMLRQHRSAAHPVTAQPSDRAPAELEGTE